MTIEEAAVLQVVVAPLLQPFPTKKMLNISD
jgi:hypothetical protein